MGCSPAKLKNENPVLVETKQLNPKISTSLENEKNAEIKESTDKNTVIESGPEFGNDDKTIDPQQHRKNQHKYSLLDDVRTLYEILDDTKTNENELINVIIPRNMEYKQRLRTEFKDIYGKDLVKNINTATNGTTQYFLTNVLLKPEEYLAHKLKIYVNNKSYIRLLEEITLWEPDIVKKAKQIYAIANQATLDEKIKLTFSKSISKGFEDVILSLVNLDRHDNDVVENDATLEEAADVLSQGAEEIVDILTRHPYSLTSLGKIFEHYKNRYYLSITDSLEIEFNNNDDDLQLVLTKMVRIAEDRTKYCHELLRHAIEDEVMEEVIDILMARHSVDIDLIAESYEKQYGSSLQQDISTICRMTDLHLITVFLNFHLHKTL